MNPNQLRFVSVGIAGVFVVTGLCICFFIQDSCFTGEGAEWFLQSWWDAFAKLDRETCRTVELSVEDEMILRRVYSKERISEELLAGRMSFAEAVARFRAVEADYPVQLRYYHFFPPGDSIEERWADYVVFWIQPMLEFDPRREEVLSWLAEEREEYLAGVSEG